MKKEVFGRVLLVVVGTIIDSFALWLISTWWTAAGCSVISDHLSKPTYLIRCWIRAHEDGFLSDIVLFSVTGVGVTLILLGIYMIIRALFKNIIQEIQ